MKKLVLIAPLGAMLFAASSSMGQSPIDGTWKIDMNKVGFAKRPDVYVLKDGMYSCKTFTPPYTVKADGSDQAVTGILISIRLRSR